MGMKICILCGKVNESGEFPFCTQECYDNYVGNDLEGVKCLT